MEKLYDRIDFHNNAAPALNESNLNAISKAIDDIDNRLIKVANSGPGGGGGGSSVEWNQRTTSGTHIADVTIDGETTEVFAPEGGSGSVTEYGTTAEFEAEKDSFPVGTEYLVTDDYDEPKTDIGIITQRITIQNHSGFNPKYDYPSGVNFNDYIILNYHECPPDYAYSRIGHNSLQANQFSSTSDRLFFEMHEDGLYVFNNTSFFDGKEIIVIYGKLGE